MNPLKADTAAQLLAHLAGAPGPVVVPPAWTSELTALLDDWGSPGDDWRHWLELAHTVQGALSNTSPGPVADLLEDWLAASADRARDQIPARLLAGWRQPFPEPAHSTELTLLAADRERTVAAWLDGTLGRVDHVSLSNAVQTRGAWQTAYRRALQGRAEAVHVARVPPASPEVARGNTLGHARRLLVLPLPHLDGRLEVVQHVDGTLWSSPLGTELLPWGTTRHVIADPVIGGLESTVHVRSLEPIESAWHIVQAATSLLGKATPDAILPLVDALNGAFGSALQACAERFSQGVDHDAIRAWWARPSAALGQSQPRPVLVAERLADVQSQAEVDALLTPGHARTLAELQLWAGHTLSLRLRLDTLVAQADDPALLEALVEADEDLAPHARGLLLLSPQDVDDLLLEDELLDPAEWWGIHQRLAMSLSDDELDRLLAGDSGD